MDGCGFDGARCAAQSSAVRVSHSATEDYIVEGINKASGLSGSVLKETRKGEGELLQKTIDESPTLRKMVKETQRNPSWREHYQNRLWDANIVDWSSFLISDHMRGTAAAYATYKTLPPVLDVIAAAPLYALGTIAGLAMAAIDMAFSRRFHA